MDDQRRAAAERAGSGARERAAVDGERLVGGVEGAAGDVESVPALKVAPAIEVERAGDEVEVGVVVEGGRAGDVDGAGV